MHTHSHTKGDMEYFWEVPALWEATKDTPISEWSIPPNLSWGWGDEPLLNHLFRVLDADLSYPVIIYNDTIVDGYHRVIKTLALGGHSIHARVISEMPTPTFVEPYTPNLTPTPIWSVQDMIDLTKAALDGSFDLLLATPQQKNQK